MGGTQSKTVVNQLNQAIIDAVMNNVVECSSSVDQNQVVNIDIKKASFWSNYNIKQVAKINSQCLSTTASQSQLQNDIFNAIKQATTAEGVGILQAFGTTKSAAETNLKNIIQSKVTVNNILKNFNNIKNNQEVNFNQEAYVFGSDFNISQEGDVFAAATLKAVQDAGIYNKITSYVDQESDAKTTNPLDFISNILSQPLYYMAFFFIVFIVIFFVILYFVFGRKSSASPPPMFIGPDGRIYGVPT